MSWRDDDINELYSAIKATRLMAHLCTVRARQLIGVKESTKLCRVYFQSWQLHYCKIFQIFHNGRHCNVFIIPNKRYIVHDVYGETGLNFENKELTMILVCTFISIVTVDAFQIGLAPLYSSRCTRACRLCQSVSQESFLFQLYAIIITSVGKELTIISGLIYLSAILFEFVSFGLLQS